jgi:hypothetical protein
MRLFMRRMKLCMPMVLMCCLLTACMSQIPGLREWADPCIGQPVGILEEIDARPESYAGRVGWRRTTYDLPDGNWVYVHPANKDCEVHFEVDEAGIVVGYRPVGEGCRYW